MEQRHAHPLDIDLLSVALGDTNVTVDSDITGHLNACLLCRIRVARIRHGNATPEPLNATGIQYPSVSPEVLAVLDSTIERGEANAGQLWLAGDRYRILVWIDDIEDGVAFVYAASLDTGAADDTALITSVPNLDRPIAVYTSVGGTIGVDRLVSYIDDLPIHDDVERLLAAAVNGTVADGLLTGSAILGVTDERLELRQLLADDLAALDPIEDDGHDDLDNIEPVLSAGGGLADHLRHDLVWRRGPQCRVHDVDATVAQLSASMTVTAVATVHELGCVVLIVSSDRGPEWALEHVGDAWALVEAAAATVLGFAEPTDPYLTVLFERHDLRDSYELPRASVKSPPRIAVAAQPIVQALHTYLDKSAFEVHPADRVEGPRLGPDLRPYLHVRARASIATLKSIGAQTGKRRALNALSDDDANGIAIALSGANDFESLLEKIEQVLER